MSGCKITWLFERLDNNKQMKMRDIKRVMLTRKHGKSATRNSKMYKINPLKGQKTECSCKASKSCLKSRHSSLTSSNLLQIKPSKSSVTKTQALPYNQIQLITFTMKSLPPQVSWSLRRLLVVYVAVWLTVRKITLVCKSHCAVYHLISYAESDLRRRERESRLHLRCQRFKQEVVKHQSQEPQGLQILLISL